MRVKFMVRQDAEPPTRAIAHARKVQKKWRRGRDHAPEEWGGLTAWIDALRL